MKRTLLTLLAALTLGTPSAMAQEAVTLDVFEQCNNWARHYCESGNHAQLVDNKLLAIKKRGLPITLQRIRMVAQGTRPAAAAPQQ